MYPLFFYVIDSRTEWAMASVAMLIYWRATSAVFRFTNDLLVRSFHAFDQPYVTSQFTTLPFRHMKPLTVTEKTAASYHCQMRLGFPAYQH